MVEIINRNTARFVGRNILINDYSGHPFPFELSLFLSKNFKIVHAFAQYFETPKANFKISCNKLSKEEVVKCILKSYETI